MQKKGLAITWSEGDSESESEGESAKHVTALHHIILHSYHLTHVYPFQGGRILLELINMSLHLHSHPHVLHNRYRHSVLSLFGVPLAG